MKREAHDWHPEDVKAAVRKTGTTLTALALANGLSESAVRRTLRCPWPKVQGLIARHLGLRPQDIWPSRYDARGRPLPGLRSTDRRHRSAGPITPHCQKSEAA
jgi:Ner family transcriptional regulator